MRRGPKFSIPTLSIEQAAHCWGKDRRTIQRLLTQAKEKADRNGYYTIAQIRNAVDTPKEREVVRKLTAEADEVEMRNAKARGELVDVDDFAKQWDSVFIKLKQTIKSSKLTEPEQVQILTELEKVLKV